MMPSTLHVAIIMDGNGRWAERRGLPRRRGHMAGADAVRRTVEAACKLGVDALTLFAFSCENWSRPRGEVDALMTLFAHYLGEETPRCTDEGVRIEVIGRRDRLPPEVAAAIAAAEALTSAGDRLRLRIAVDYSARDAVERAAARIAATRNAVIFSDALAAAVNADPDTPPIDLLIRTGGELRLSDQFPWEAAYAELRFVQTMWPDFAAADLADALEDLSRRRRRFGGLPAENADLALESPR